MAVDPGPPDDKKPDLWILIAGCGFGALTLLYLMIFPLVNITTGGRLACGDTYLMSMVFGLGVGLSSAFLGGYAAANGNIRLPIIGGDPMAVSIAGGIAFLIVGATVAYMLSNHSCANPHQSFVRPFFSEWNFDPTGKNFSFRLDTERRESGGASFVAAAQSENYDVYVAARAKGENDVWAGTYEHVLGPYGYATGDRVRKNLTAEQTSSLGKCVQLITFGVPRTSRPGVPFTVNADAIQRFQWAGVCTEDSYEIDRIGFLDNVDQLECSCPGGCVHAGPARQTCLD